MPCTKLPLSALAKKAAMAALCSSFKLGIGTTIEHDSNYNRSMHDKKLRAKALQPCSDPASIHETLPDSCARMGKHAVPQTLHSSRHFFKPSDPRMHVWPVASLKISQHVHAVLCMVYIELTPPDT